ncbi:MAG: M20 family metallopeptidase [Oscillospiraceae bacterium]
MARIHPLANKHSEELSELLKWFHSHPELGMNEIQTTSKIREVLKKLKIETIELGQIAGVIGVIRGGDGTAVALRADIDAIIQDEQVERPDKSLFPGMMHACGHDTHIVSLLGAAYELSERSAELTGDVFLIFQPSEETLCGAQHLVDLGLFDRIKPKAIFGLHNSPELPVGSLGLKKGQLMSFKDLFSIRVVGRSGHSSTPQNNIDPIAAIASIIQGINTIVSHNVGPLDSAVITICQLHAGKAGTIIVDDAVLSGNIRTLDAGVRKRVLARLESIAEMTSKAYECSVEFHCEKAVSGVINSDLMYDIARQAASNVFDDNHIIDPPVNLASEDFSVYSNFAPSFFYFVGSGSENENVYSWHNAHFRANPLTHLYGAAILSQSVFTAQELIS